jgi:hypothetical protein
MKAIAAMPSEIASSLPPGPFHKQVKYGCILSGHGNQAIAGSPQGAMRRKTRSLSFYFSRMSLTYQSKPSSTNVKLQDLPCNLPRSPSGVIQHSQQRPVP